tara:strand:+ start:247 stop:957 length:711 start_codon:yes stop_codon:yes gene_type:complete
MKRGIKKKDYERLTDSNIQEVLTLLESGTPFTKKEACLKLNIAYNTTRLNNIIAEFKDKLEFQEKRRSHNRGKPATPQEISEAVVMYLNKESISTIASSLYRSSSFVKGILNRVGIPSVPTKENSSEIGFLPEVMLSTTFKANEMVWSARHHGLAQIREELTLEEQKKPGYLRPIDYEKREGSKLYNIYVLEKGDFSNSYFPNVQCGGFFSCSYAYDVGKLDHLIELGVDISRLEK